MRLEEARHKANAIRAEMRSGFDRFREIEKRRNVPLLSVVWDDYLAQHARPKKAPRSVAEDQSLWRVHIESEFASKRINEIGAADVRRWHASKSETPYAANRALSLMSKLMSFAIGQEWIERNVCAGVQKFAEAPRDLTPSDATIL